MCPSVNEEQMVLFGGFDSRLNEPRSTLYTLSKKEEGLWEWLRIKCEGGPSERHSHAACTLGKPPQTLVVSGGEHEHDVWLDVHMLNLESLEWLKVQSEGALPSFP